MLKFGFIGVGQVGGLMADLAKEFHHESLAINTAKVDLNVLQHLEDNEKFHLVGYEGAGKDREIGKEAFLMHQDVIIEKIKERMKDCHVLFPVFALGGGTGSGITGSLLQLLVETFEDKVVSPIAFLPSRSESLRCKMNALEAFSELSMIEDIGSTFIIDNQQVMDLHHSFTLQERYVHTRLEFMNLLYTFNEFTNRESEISNLDNMDLLTVLSERGCSMLSEVTFEEEETIDDETVSNQLLSSLKYSVYAETTYHSFTKVACLLECPSSVTTTLNLDHALKHIGNPLESFKGIYETEKSKEKTKLSILIAGLPFPTMKLKQMEQDIKENEENFMQNITTSREQTFSVKDSWTTSLKKKRKIKM